MSVAWQIEIDPACNRVLERHWPGVKRYGDIRQVDPRELEPVDVLVGGFPCTDVSVAGHRAGLVGKQSGLWWEFHRLIAALRPDWVVVENVPGLLSSFSPVQSSPGKVGPGAGWTVEETSDLAVVLSSLGELRYWWAYRVLDSRYFHVAQRRQRVFIVASAGGPAGPATVLFQPESCQGNPSSGRAPGTRSAAGAEGGAGESGIANALTSHHGRNDPSEETLVPVVVDLAQITSRQNGTNPQPGDPAPTMNGSGQAITFNWQASVGQDRSWRGKGRQSIVRAGDYAGAVSATRVDAVATPMVIRRLTPREAERLMGLPDDWTAVDAGGKPISDSARYRLCGNAVVVPVVTWILRRLAQVACEEESG